MPKQKPVFPRVKPDTRDFSDVGTRSAVRGDADRLVKMAEDVAAAALERSAAVKTVAEWLVDPSTQRAVDPDVLSSIYRLLQN